MTTKYNRKFEAAAEYAPAVRASRICVLTNETDRNESHASL
jgi:hypothetical protein